MSTLPDKLLAHAQKRWECRGLLEKHTRTLGKAWSKLQIVPENEPLNGSFYASLDQSFRNTRIQRATPRLYRFSGYAARALRTDGRTDGHAGDLYIRYAAWDVY